MSTSILDPSLAASSLGEAHVQSLRRQAEVRSPAEDARKREKLQKACEGFEAVFIQKMWEGMRASLPKEGLMHSREEQFWQGMYDQELGKSMASAGGIGLADMMMSQLARNLQGASAIAAHRNSRVPMSIPPVSILPGRNPAPVAPVEEVPPAPPAPAPAASIYEGEAVQPQAEAPVIEPPAPDPVKTALDDLAGQVAVTRTTTRVYGPGQATQSIDDLAASLAAQAAREGGSVRVTTIRQANGPSSVRSSSRNPVVRRSRTREIVAGGSPVTGRGDLEAAPGRRGRVNMAGPARMEPVSEQAPAALTAPSAGQNPDAQNGPQALITSVSGLGESSLSESRLGESGSNFASNSAAAQKIPGEGSAR